MAGRLLAVGHNVIVWNRTPTKTTPLAERGAAVAASPAEAAARADAVITMVSDPSALHAVTEGPGGIAAGIGPNGTILEMSTVGPAALVRLAAVLPDGAQVLDAPVLGSVTKAESGSLVIFVGGSDELVARWAPLLSALGTPLHVGALGAGASAKLVANAVMFGVVAVLGEALGLAERLDLSREAAFEVLASTPLAAQAQRRRDAIERAEYPPRFRLSLAHKDARLIEEASRSHDLDLRLAEAARSWLADAEAAGLGDHDYTAMLACIIAATNRPTSPKVIGRNAAMRSYRQ